MIFFAHDGFHGGSYNILRIARFTHMRRIHDFLVQWTISKVSGILPIAQLDVYRSRYLRDKSKTLEFALGRQTGGMLDQSAQPSKMHPLKPAFRA